jgi:glucose/arabinose dehydrogenase
MSRRIWLALLLTLLAAAAPGRAAFAQEIRAVRVGAATFAHPVFVTAPPGDKSRLFVVDQPGTIRILDAATGELNPTPFLTIPNVLYSGEAGLLGMAFHPHFAENGYFFVYYSRNSTATNPTGRMIARYRVSDADPNVADPASGATVFFYPIAIGIHNGGWMDFGPDGKLYVAWGNRGVSANSPDLTTPLGKLLRLDVDGADGVPGTSDDDQFPDDPNRNYVVPADNPFAGTANEQAIWAYGLRNPWRDSFDRATGDLYIADVGDGTWEEVDYAPPPPSAPGRNYGYPCMEGPFCQGSTTSTSCACNNPTLTPPIYAYRHTLGCAIQGGYVYRGCAMPWINGQYVFGDYCSSRIWTGRNNGTALVEVTERTTEVWGTGSRPLVLSLGQDARGELYICGGNGAIYKLVPAVLPDCNGNGVPDGCDIALGTSRDVDHNGMPDECQTPPPCRPCDPDFDQDGDPGTDADIETFFASVAGSGPLGADFNGDGDAGTDADIEAFFRVLAGGSC